MRALGVAGAGAAVGLLLIAVVGYFVLPRIEDVTL